MTTGRFLPWNLSTVPTADSTRLEPLSQANDMGVERRYDKDVATYDLMVLSRFINPLGT